ncbi:TPA: cellulase family glycosylhydrolase [Serratia fonticola]|uniref:cellulase family glycosylhydrolase n=1 Tax=Serratia fonticola TaxID=47917 RepID=UPI002182D00B|nr:cellulase family glycosylhydrolase [Serratia fonticola]CAI2432923.1 Beta-xylosidase [Serratia fonticola]
MKSNHKYFFSRKVIAYLLVALSWCNQSNAFELGVGTHFHTYEKNADYYLSLIKEYGFTSFRDDYSWSKVERYKNKYSIYGNLLATDNAFERARKYGLNGLMVLDYGNKLYDGGGYPISQEAVNAFANYAAWSAARFKGKIKYFEVWNEWSNATSMSRFKNSIPSEKAYFNLVKTTALAIKKVNPEAIILAGSFNPISDPQKPRKPTQTDWFLSLVSLGILNYIDGISIHPYSYKNSQLWLRTPEGNISQVDVFQSTVKEKTGKILPIYITEIGLTNYTGEGGVSEEYAGEFVKKYMSLVKSRKYIKGVWWYDLIDDGENPSINENRFGIFDRSLAPKKSALYFLQNK